ncbi:DUF1330 domain-containing protein [Streptomyces mutabilis]|uniref:DUF1330 domain-containing protein n=1 Tax=Streptomyces mutabilis TaxID=67332 RepID=UPI00177F25A1|nr:DUF1330 domain-containing protein [Streptomyces mutabilis]GGQ33607.1 hypothetical protein GCM10010279_47750 [Streptomyces mutabilis]
MPKAYVIMTEAIRHEEGMAAYGKVSAASMTGAGARVRAVDPRPQILEGEWHGDRTVIVEFDSVEAARAWYESAGYQEAIPLRQAAAVTNAVLVAGLSPRLG